MRTPNSGAWVYRLTPMAVNAATPTQSLHWRVLRICIRGPVGGLRGAVFCE
jgi:hypothetical protein